MKKAKTILAALLCMLLGAACGGSSSPSTIPAGPTPGTASPSPSPSPSPSSRLSWVEVSEFSQCPSHVENCPTARGFNIDSGGAFSVDSQAPSGNVSAGDLSQLNSIASVYAANAGLLGFSCFATPTIPGGPGDTTISITYSNGDSQTIISIETAPRRTCILGSVGNALSLYELMTTLAGKYNAT